MNTYSFTYILYILDTLIFFTIFAGKNLQAIKECFKLFLLLQIRLKQTFYTMPLIVSLG